MYEVEESNDDLVIEEQWPITRPYPFDDEPVVEIETESGINLELGFVTDCKKLNIRAEPLIGAQIVCELPVKSEVMIEDFSLIGEFYKVYTTAGIEGYCLKKFISIQS